MANIPFNKYLIKFNLRSFFEICNSKGDHVFYYKIWKKTPIKQSKWLKDLKWLKDANKKKKRKERSQADLLEHPGK